MKAIKFLSRMVLAMALMMAFAMSAEAQSYETAQSYKLIKTVEGNGTVWDGKGTRHRFIFDGNIVHYYYAANYVNKYQYSHQSNGNAVYYLLAYDYLYNRTVLNEREYMLVSPDRELINKVSTTCGVTTQVYRLDKNNGIEEMIR